jgi:hypothetical protein
MLTLGTPTIALRSPAELRDARITCQEPSGLIPCYAACSSNLGQRSWAAVSSMRTRWPSRMACRQGPSSSSYCASSTRAASGSLHATVTGRPLRPIVIPHDRPR